MCRRSGFRLRLCLPEPSNMFTISLRSMFRRAAYRFSTVGEKERRACEGILMGSGSAECLGALNTGRGKREMGGGGLFFRNVEAFLFGQNQSQLPLWRCPYPLIDLVQSLISGQFQSLERLLSFKKKTTREGV